MNSNNNINEINFFTNTMKSKGYIKHPIYHCYFCENKIASGINNIQSFTLDQQIKIRDIYKINDAILCNTCYDKYFLLVKCQGIDSLKTEIEREEEERKVVCGSCEHKVLPDEGGQVGISFFCNACKILPIDILHQRVSENRKKGVKEHDHDRQ